MSDDTKTIGALNGKWSVLFRVLLAINACLLPPAITWAAWLTSTVITLKWEMRLSTMDRLSGAAFIEIQDRLATKNPEVKWLTAREVREIQNNNPPYK